MKNVALYVVDAHKGTGTPQSSCGGGQAPRAMGVLAWGGGVLGGGEGQRVHVHCCKPL
jgi:hypothetical protein